MKTTWDVAIVGGGPAGLAAAIESARRGFTTLVLEKRALPADKPCGEGILPTGVERLARIGVLSRILEGGAFPLRTLRYVNEDGGYAQAPLPGLGGLGVRRTLLSKALWERAVEVGATIRDQTNVAGCRRLEDAVELDTSFGPIRARLLIAADGLGSALRSAPQQNPLGGRGRFGVRRHFEISPWSSGVEVHFGPGCEAYVTPVGPAEVGVALLWRRGSLPPRRSPGLLPAGERGFDDRLRYFPALGDRLSGARATSSPKGAGPFHRRAASVVADRLVLLGDAAGYVDAITGEGTSLAFQSAQLLGQLLPSVLAQSASRSSLEPYAAGWAKAFRRYAALTWALLAIAERPFLRRGVVRGLSKRPGWFEALVRFGVGERLTLSGDQQGLEGNPSNLPDLGLG